MFYSLGQIFRHRAMSKAVKCKIYITLVKPVVVYGSETWTMREIDMKRLNTLERKILRRIYVDQW
jgi:hypothetical protein